MSIGGVSPRTFHGPWADVECGHTGCAQYGGGDRNDTAAGAKIKHPSSGDQIGSLHHVHEKQRVVLRRVDVVADGRDAAPGWRSGGQLMPFVTVTATVTAEITACFSVMPAAHSIQTPPTEMVAADYCRVISENPPYAGRSA